MSITCLDKTAEQRKTRMKLEKDIRGLRRRASMLLRRVRYFAYVDIG